MPSNKSWLSTLRRWTFIAAATTGCVLCCAVFLVWWTAVVDAAGRADGLVLAPDGSPIANAEASLIYSSATETVTTDARGCFHIFRHHSPDDLTTSIGVTHPGWKSWKATVSGIRDVDAIVQLEPLSSPVPSHGILHQQWNVRDSLVDRCRDTTSTPLASPGPPGR